MNEHDEQDKLKVTRTWLKQIGATNRENIKWLAVWQDKRAHTEYVVNEGLHYYSHMLELQEVLSDLYHINPPPISWRYIFNGVNMFETEPTNNQGALAEAEASQDSKVSGGQTTATSKKDVEIRSKPSLTVAYTVRWAPVPNSEEVSEVGDDDNDDYDDYDDYDEDGAEDEGEEEAYEGEEETHDEEGQIGDEDEVTEFSKEEADVKQLETETDETNRDKANKLSHMQNDYNQFTSSDGIYDENWREVYELIDGNIRTARDRYDLSSRRFFRFDPWNEEQKEMIASVSVLEEPVQSYLMGAMMMHWATTRPF
jgi:hypothetical protein